MVLALIRVFGDEGGTQGRREGPRTAPRRLSFQTFLWAHVFRVFKGCAST